MMNLWDKLHFRNPSNCDLKWSYPYWNNYYLKWVTPSFQCFWMFWWVLVFSFEEIVNKIEIYYQFWEVRWYGSELFLYIQLLLVNHRHHCLSVLFFLFKFLSSETIFPFSLLSRIMQVNSSKDSVRILGW